MQMILSMRLGVLDALLQNLLRLLDELAVQINRVRRYTPVGVVLAEYELGCLLVVFFHFAPVRLAFLRELLCACPIAARVRFFRLDGYSDGLVPVQLAATGP